MNIQAKHSADATTVEEIRRLAGEIFTADQLRLAVVGPVSPDESLEELLVL